MTAFMLNEKIAIITGASSGIGRATALCFARAGAKVVAGARRQKELYTLVQEIEACGGEALALAGDVQHESFAQQLVEIAEQRFGGLDIAFNNAGILGPMRPTPEINIEAWDTTMRTNLRSGFLAAKYQIPAMLKRGGGSIIFTSTFVGHTIGMPNMAAYAASKSGLIGLTQSLASEFGHQNLRINALLPGGTDTAMGREVAHRPEIMEFVQNLHAMKRIASPEEIANAALFLASNASSFCTGTALLVDGGISIHRS